MSEPARETIHTIGHSNRTLEQFIRLLYIHGVKRVADIRTLPRSKRHPHFNAGPLRQSLGRVAVLHEF